MGKIKNLFTSGRMNKDLDERLVPNGEYRDALNVKVSNSNGSDVGAVENALSNEALSSESFGPNPRCIGAIADDKNRKIYWFVKSDAGSYIMEYSKDTGDVDFVLTDTRPEETSVLNFSKGYLITGVNILIDQDNDKVFIYWTDGLNPPRKIEVSESKKLNVNGFTDSDISVIKAPPRKEPVITGILYDEDSIEPNLISDKFFCFSYRYKYSDNQFSAISPFSGFAFKPGNTDIDFLDTTTDSMRNNFSAVNVSINTGGKDVIGIEVLARESNGANLFLVKKINKEKENVQDNIDYSFIFENKGVYSVLPEDEFNRAYDNVPLSAFSQEFIGNRLVYANYVENYDVKDSLENEINFNIISSIVSDDLQLSCPTSTSYTIRKVGAGEDLSFKRCGESDWTVLDIEQGEYVEVCASELSNISTNPSVYSVTDNGPCEAYIGEPTMKSNRTYEIGVVYFDSYGRKSPVLTSSSSSVFVPHFNASKSNKIKCSINFNPPYWADRYKFAIKQVDSDFDVIRTRGPLYQVKEGSIRYVYISLPQLELNKIVEGGILVLKNNGVQFNNSTTNQFRVISVESFEAGWNDNSGEAGTYVKLQGPAELFEDNSSLTVPTTSKDIIFETFSIVDEEVPYYEVPGTYDIIDGFHTGNIQNQAQNQAAEVLLDVHNAYSFGNGVESIKIDDDKTKSSISIGVRVNEVFDDYRQNIRSSSLTYGGVYDQTTNYNALNEFNLSLANYKDMDDQYGSIKKIHSRDSDLIVFQENKIHNILFNKSVLFNADGTGNVSQTVSILGQEVPYKGEYGISSSPESFQSWGYKMYFADERRGAICRLSNNGIVEISDYGMHDWFVDNLSVSNETFTLGGYDPTNDQYIVSLISGLVEWKEDTYICDEGQVEWREDSYSCVQATTTTTTTTTQAPITTTTTTQAPVTTTTTQAPTPFVQIEAVTSAQINDVITMTAEDYNFTGSNWAWTGGSAEGLTSKTINITETTAGSKTYGVTVDGTYSDSHTVDWSLEPTTTTTSTTTTSTTTTSTTTTTTTAAPTTTTTTAAATTTTTTAAPEPVPPTAKCDYIFVEDGVDERYGVRYIDESDNLVETTFISGFGTSSTRGGVAGTVYGYCSQIAPQTWDSVTNTLVEVPGVYYAGNDNESCTTGGCMWPENTVVPENPSEPTPNVFFVEKADGTAGGVNYLQFAQGFSSGMNALGADGICYTLGPTVYVSNPGQQMTIAGSC